MLGGVCKVLLLFSDLVAMASRTTVKLGVSKKRRSRRVAGKAQQGYGLCLVSPFAAAEMWPGANGIKPLRKAC